MSDSTPASGVQAQAATAAASTNSTTKSTPTSGSGGTKSSFSSIGELQREQPELYRLLMEGSFVSFMKQNNASKDRIHKLNREQYRG